MKGPNSSANGPSSSWKITFSAALKPRPPYSRGHTRQAQPASNFSRCQWRAVSSHSCSVSKGWPAKRIGGRDTRHGCRFAQDIAVAAERGGAEAAVGARQLDAHQHVGHQVLQRLERADRAAEGVALEAVAARRIERGLGAAELLEGD